MKKQREILGKLNPATTEQKAHLAEITQTDLACLAAILDRNDEADLVRLARRAYELWEACGKELASQKLRAMGREKTLQEQIERRARTPPWPHDHDGKATISLDEFLRLMMPKTKPVDRMKFYRDFLKARFPGSAVDSTGKVIKDADTFAEKEIKQAKERGFSKTDYGHEARDFLTWQKGRKEAVAKERASKGGKAKAAKHTPKKNGS